ncbi:MAG: hypothetical protein JW857_10685 [Bacteroidales bacterium]|nr:hypothetical protein [Bacteroidales bacterium]
METLKALILKEHSKAQALFIADIIHQKPELIDDLIAFTFAQSEPLSRRAAWPLRIIQDQYPELLINKIDSLISMLQKKHDFAVQRNVLALLISAKIPIKQQGFLLDYTTNLLLDLNSPIAVIAHASDLYLKLADNEIILINELILMLEELRPIKSGGIKAKLAHIYKHLDRIKKHSV